MRYLWSRLPEIEKQILSTKKLLLLLDYDGTLAPIAPTSEQARLKPPTKLVLRRLSQRPHVTVAIISGRTLADLKRMVGLKDLAYAGNHGLGLWWRDNRQTVKVPRATQKILTELRRVLSRECRNFAGAVLENKGLSLSLHYRQVEAKRVARLKSVFRNCITPFLHSGKVCVVKGKKVFDIRPHVTWTKGHAALWFMRRIGTLSSLPIYIGDDQTDEDAFEILKAGITVRVRKARRSKARYCVRGVKEVVRFLQWLEGKYA